MVQYMMPQYLLVVEGLMTDGSDAAMYVDGDTYKAAMFDLAFKEPVDGYVWCDTHGWVRSDESCVCNACVQECMDALALAGAITVEDYFA